jgi:hypothetical protein
MASVPGEKFGLAYVVQPGGRGSVTVRSVSLSRATCSPVTPTLDRYWAIGVGDVGGAVVVTTGLDVQTLE